MSELTFWGSSVARQSVPDTGARLKRVTVLLLRGQNHESQDLGAIVATLTLSAAASAGTISGKVSGVPTESVVYVEAIAGKTFPAPTAHAQMDQRAPISTQHSRHTTRDNCGLPENSYTVAHNVAWSSVGGNKRLAHNMGTWPKGEKRSFKFDNAGAVPLMC